MRTDDRAKMLDSVNSSRKALDSTRNGLTRAIEIVDGWQQGRIPVTAELSGMSNALGAGIKSIDALSTVADEFERLIILAPTDGLTDDSAPGAEPTVEKYVGVLGQIEGMLIGMHEAATGMSTLLAALAQGQTQTQAEYRQHQQGVLGIASMADEARVQIAAMRRAAEA